MGNGRKWLRLSVVVMGVSLGTGCMSPPQAARERLAALEAEGEELDSALDSVEERLLGNQAALQTWEEMGRRHQQVTQLHCQTADAHLTALMKHYEKMERKGRQLKRRSSMAAVDLESTVLTAGKASRRQRSSSN